MNSLLHAVKKKLNMVRKNYISSWKLLRMSLLQAADTAVSLKLNGDYGLPTPDYMDENVSDKVVRIIQGYTRVVNKMVWRK